MPPIVAVTFAVAGLALLLAWMPSIVSTRIFRKGVKLLDEGHARKAAAHFRVCRIRARKVLMDRQVQRHKSNIFYNACLAIYLDSSLGTSAFWHADGELAALAAVWRRDLYWTMDVHYLLAVVRCCLEKADAGLPHPAELAGVAAVEAALLRIAQMRFVPLLVRYKLADCFVQVGRIYAAAHDFDASLERLERALAVLPGTSARREIARCEVYFWIFSVCSSRGDRERMRECSQQALAIAGRHRRRKPRLLVEALCARALLLDEEGREEEAVASFRDAIAAAGGETRENRPQLVLCHYKVAKRTAQTDPEGSDDHFEAAIKLLTGDDSSPRSTLIMVYEAYAEALRDRFQFDEASAMEEAASELRDRFDPQDEAS